jgi:hypothetical protein
MQLGLELELDEESCVAPGLNWIKSDGDMPSYYLYDRITYTGWRVDHCGHPTALRPYAISDDNEEKAYATHNGFAFRHVFCAKWSAEEMYKAKNPKTWEHIDIRIRSLRQSRGIDRSINFDAFPRVPYKFRGRMDEHIYLGAKEITSDKKKFQVDLVDKHKRGRNRVVESVKIEATDRNDAKRIAEYQWIGNHETVFDIREAGLKEPLPTDWMISTLDKLVKQGMKFPQAGYMKWEDKYIVSQDYTYFHPGGWKQMRLPDGYEIVVRR